MAERDPIKQALKEDYEMRRWDSTREDLDRARRELRQMEATPSYRIADLQAFLDKIANKKLFIAKLEADLDRP
jgi:Spy/CpxP family protein refolding chaperone